MTTDPPKISDADFARLQDHVRLQHGLKDAPVRRPSGRRKSVALFAAQPSTTASPCLAAVAAAAGVDWATAVGAAARPAPRVPGPRPRTNKTFDFRRQCVEKRLRGRRLSDRAELREARRIHERNLRPKRNDYFRLNKAFHMRWKNIRGLPVVHAHFRHAFLDTGKPPFVVPVHYKPFNVYWDADYAKQEFIFLDAAAEDKKKDKKATVTPEPPVATAPPEPPAQAPRKSSSLRRESDSLGQQPHSSAQLPRKSSSLRRESDSLGQQPHSSAQLPRKSSSLRRESDSLGQQPQSAAQLPRKSSSLRRESDSLGQQPQSSAQLPRTTSSQISQERRERESTGYEGFPRDSLIEAEERAYGAAPGKFSR